MDKTPRTSLIDIPSDRCAYSSSPFKLKNSLSTHPLFENERIKKLLRALPREMVEIREVKSAEANDGSYKRGAMLDKADPVRTFEELGEKPMWMLLHHTWKHDKDYMQLLKDYVAELGEKFDGAEGELSDLGCWMFLSSGKCVVHFHADPDQSILNQIRGSKTVFVYPMKVLPEPVVEKLIYTGDQGAVSYNPEYEKAMFDPVPLGGGESVFLPLFAPHRVINDPGVSVAWNVGFHNWKSRQRRNTHFFNLELRTMGLNPAPYSDSLMDRVKSRSYIAFKAKNKLFPALKPKTTL